MSDATLVRNAADPDQVKTARRHEKRSTEKRADLVRGQLASYSGRAFVWDELARHGLYQDIAGPHEVTYPLLGRRSAGLELLAEVMREPELYLKMQTEAVERESRTSREIEASHTARASETLS